MTPTLQTVLDYVTISSTGDAADFGDLSVARQFLASNTNSVRLLNGGGHSGSTDDTIDYITIASTGNAADYGDLTGARQGVGATSNGHGGLS
mgnify:CR=1 FL=1